MKNYWDRLDAKVAKYKNKYPGSPKKVALRLAYWNAISLLPKRRKGRKTPPDELHIAFAIGGGIGDIVMGMLFVEKFLAKMDCRYKAWLFVGQSLVSVRSLLAGKSYLSGILDMGDFDEVDFDFSVRLDVQYPEISHVNAPKIDRFSPYLRDYARRCADFCKTYQRMLGGGVSTFLQQSLCLIQNKTRITAMDICGILDIAHDDKLNLKVPPEGYAVLERYGLERGKFITIQRGVDVKNTSSESTRLWSLDSYTRLAMLIGKKYPQLKIVQLGVSQSRCQNIGGTDINLVGKTTFAEAMALLDASLLHIDGECGMVHIRHFLSGGTSVVLFGPTSPKTKGYAENINLRAAACDCTHCEWLIGGEWQNVCLKTWGSPACMDAISPAFVMGKIDAFMESAGVSAAAGIS